MPGNPGHRCMQWTNGDAAMPGNPGHAADTRLRRKNANYIILALPRIDLVKFNILNPYRQYLDTINEIYQVY